MDSMLTIFLNKKWLLHFDSTYLSTELYPSRMSIKKKNVIAVGRGRSGGRGMRHMVAITMWMGAAPPQSRKPFTPAKIQFVRLEKKTSKKEVQPSHLPGPISARPRNGLRKPPKKRPFQKYKNSPDEEKSWPIQRPESPNLALVKKKKWGILERCSAPPLIAPPQIGGWGLTEPGH